MDITIKTVKNQDGTTITLAGRLNTVTSQELAQELEAALPDTTSLTLDLNELDYISSAGLRLLVTAQKRMKSQQGSMTIINVCEAVNEVFDITGLSTVFRIIKK